MIAFTVFDGRDGRICFCGSASDMVQARLQIRSGYQDVILFAAASGETHYAPGGEITPRPSIDLPAVSVPLGSASVPVSPPLPAGTLVERALDGSGYQAPVARSQAGEILHMPGALGVTHYLVTPPWPLRPATLTVTVTE